MVQMEKILRDPLICFLFVGFGLFLLFEVISSDDAAYDSRVIKVDLKTANWTNTMGASELATVWTDRDFDADQRAAYFVRMLEIPTPRWVLYDKVRLGAEIPEGAELIGQERVYTSPIWYTP